MYLYAVGVSPPLQPWSTVSQETVCCTESSTIEWGVLDCAQAVSTCTGRAEANVVRRQCCGGHLLGGGERPAGAALALVLDGRDNAGAAPVDLVGHEERRGVGDAGVGARNGLVVQVHALELCASQHESARPTRLRTRRSAAWGTVEGEVSELGHAELGVLGREVALVLAAELANAVHVLCARTRRRQPSSHPTALACAPQRRLRDAGCTRRRSRRSACERAAVSPPAMDCLRPSRVHSVARPAPPFTLP